MYTLQDLDNAKSELRQWNERCDNYSGNNPDKYQSDIRAARDKVRDIEQALKDSGQLPLTEKEVLIKALDKAFPSAQSKEIVEFQGKRYQKRFILIGRSRSGKTNQWEPSWEPVTDTGL